jgi:FtsP/CotA-like multicopper oxidase with cupredoxin domain
VDEPAETNAGLLGPIVVTARGKARRDGSPHDVDREFIVAFMIFNEDNDEERGLMHGINGYIFGNLRGLSMRNGEKVRWYVLGMGNEVDLHTAHWHGKALFFRSRHTDVIELLPASMATADMVADNPGTWMLHCHVADHIAAGMVTTFTIEP